jgi:hypothetical protein
LATVRVDDRIMWWAIRRAHSVLLVAAIIGAASAEGCGGQAASSEGGVVLDSGGAGGSSGSGGTDAGSESVETPDAGDAADAPLATDATDSPVVDVLADTVNDGGAEDGPAVDAGAVVGSACESDADCERGFCHPAWPGGYCTRSCDAPGERDLCGRGFLCSYRCDAESAQPQCLETCSTGSDCRDGYACEADALQAEMVCVPAECEDDTGCTSGRCVSSGLCGKMCL